MPTPLENVNNASEDGALALLRAQRLDESGDWLVLPWCIGQVAPCVGVGHVHTSSMSIPAAARTGGAIIAPNCKKSATTMSHDGRRRTERITWPEYHFPTIPSLDTGEAQRETWTKGRVNSRGHGSSVGEAPAQHTGHCRRGLERDCQGRTGTPGSRVFLRWLRVVEPTLYGARC